MEEAADKDFQIRKIQFKRKVSIFKRRKKADVRPFVLETRLKKFKKILVKLFFLVCVLFALAFILYGIRYYMIPYLFEPKEKQIISPIRQTMQILDIEREIKNSGLNIEDIKFSKDLSVVIFMLNGEIKVYLDPKDDIKSMLILLKAIENQMIEDNKKAIYIDLRYNKPIVKF